MKSTADIWRVKVVRTTVNSVGRKFREGWMITFFSFEKAFRYWARTRYELQCTDRYVIPANVHLELHEPDTDIQLMDDCNRKSYLSEYELP